MLDLTRARARMVDVQIARRGVRDRSVLDAIRRVPREAFVQPGFEEFAYEDGPLPIGEGQTISQPYTVALMIEAAEVRPGDHVLEVGAGSGYAAAVLSQIADRVYAIERHPSLGEAARRRFERLGHDNIELRVGDGTKGWLSRDRQLTPPRRSLVMPHAFRVGQLVALAQTSRDPETYEVVQLMPESPSGEPQYRIKGLSSGIVRAVREAEINPRH